MFLVLVTSACGGSVGLGDLFDGGTAGSSGSSTGSTSGSSGSGSGTASGSSGSGTSGSTSGSGSGTSGSTTGTTSGSGSGSTSATTGAGGGPDPGTTGAGGAGTTTTTTGTGGRPGTGGAGGTGGSAICGGFIGMQCPKGSYCDYPDGSCGAADQSGVCRVYTGNVVCTADCPGVCGCDGKFYCNACVAAGSGVDVTADRSCTRDAGPTPTPDAGKRCGGLIGGQCDANSYCDYFGSGCGIVDASGVCQPRPQGCTTDCPGVCGCDGKFYCNACTAASLGVDVNPSNTTCPRL